MKTLKSRMKKNELYVVYSGHTEAGVHFLSYRDPARTPRIFCKDSLDPRVGHDLPICRTLKAADRLLAANHYAVVIPLSVVIEQSTPSEVRSWAQEQRSVTPDAVRQYVTAWLMARHSHEGLCRPSYGKLTAETVRCAHKAWIAKNSDASVGDLVAYLDAVRVEFLQHDEDDLLADHIADLNKAADYLSGWGDVSEPVVDDELPTFGYRFANLEEDIQEVDELIGLFGESHRLADLPKDEPQKKAG